MAMRKNVALRARVKTVNQKRASRRPFATSQCLVRNWQLSDCIHWGRRKPYCFLAANGKWAERRSWKRKGGKSKGFLRCREAFNIARWSGASSWQKASEMLASSRRVPNTDRFYSGTVPRTIGWPVARSGRVLAWISVCETLARACQAL